MKCKINKITYLQKANMQLVQYILESLISLLYNRGILIAVISLYILLTINYFRVVNEVAKTNAINSHLYKTYSDTYQNYCLMKQRVRKYKKLYFMSKKNTH